DRARNAPPHERGGRDRSRRGLLARARRRRPARGPLRPRGDHRAMRRLFLWSGLSVACFVAASANAGALPPPTPSPTPTPRAKLSGGFGRAVVTPSSPGSTGQSMADVVHAAETNRGKEGEKKAGVKIDNDTLVTDPTKGKLTTTKASAVPPARPAPAPPAPRAGITPAAAAAPGAAAPGAPPAPTPTVALYSDAPSPEEAKWREAS